METQWAEYQLFVSITYLRKSEYPGTAQFVLNQRHLAAGGLRLVRLVSETDIDRKPQVHFLQLFHTKSLQIVHDPFILSSSFVLKAICGNEH